MDAETLERNYASFIEESSPLHFTQGLIAYLDHVFRTPMLSGVFLEKFAKKEAGTEKALKTHLESLGVKGSFMLLLEFKEASEIIRMKSNLPSTIKYAKTKGLRGRKIINMMEWMRQLDAPEGTYRKEETSRYLSVGELKTATKVVHTYFIRELSERGYAKPDKGYWVVFRGDDYYFDGEKVYIPNKNAKYAKIFMVVVSLKKDGDITYKEIIEECRKKKFKTDTKKIQRALCGTGASFFEHAKGISQTVGSGIDLFVANKAGGKLRFNNKR